MPIGRASTRTVGNLVPHSSRTKIKEDELFDKFYAKLKNIVNLVFNLGETIPEPKIVRNVPRSLPSNRPSRRDRSLGIS